jgi:polysaccharide export outer membrane protein
VTVANHPRRAFLTSGSVLALSMITGCATLPSDGPSTSAVEAGAARHAGPTAPYVLVDLDEATAHALAAASPLPVVGTTGLPQGQVIGLMGQGDLLRVTLWEANPTGTTLLGTPGLDVSVRVGADGTITVPYVGRVRAAGRTPAQAEWSLRGALTAQGHDMQVSVLVSEDVTNAVMVQGDVAHPGRYPIGTGSQGLLDILAMAGGAREPNHSVTVKVTRGTDKAEATLSSVVAAPSGEWQLAPGDRLMILPRARFFYAFGAVNRPGEQPFDGEEISMARTLARISGLSDNRANPRGLFIYRHQDADVTRRLLGAALRPDQDPTQVVFRVDLRDPKGFFVSEAFRVMPEDIVYVSNAPLADASKAMQLISGVSSVAAMPRNMGAGY